MSLSSQKLRSVSSFALRVGAGLAVLASASKASAITANEVAPIYLSPGNEQAINVSIPGNAQTSWGYFFDVAIDGQGLNALGIAAPLTGTGTYDVTLWSYVNGGGAVADYTQLATTSFTSACVGCTPKGNFLWLDVPTIRLPKTSTDPTRGYVVTAVGNFAAGEQVIYYNGTGTFSSAAVYEGGGYNFTNGTGFPIPLGAQSDVITNPGDVGFFNSNISLFEVPGPLPIFGAAAAFGWSRRMRRRISAAS